ncbi:MAG: hypothetical protein AAGB19_19415 [Cyanobacteria bacterium P01_F01_bin.3]
MADLVAQMKEHLLSSRVLATSQNKNSSLLTPADSPDFTLECSIQRLKGKGNIGLSSRVNYYFSSRVPASLNDVFRYVDTLNPLLQHSEVFVVQDLDGDHGYYLRMDTVRVGCIDSENVSVLLDNVTQDIHVFLQYFRYDPINQLPVPQEQFSPLPQCG